MSQESCTKLKYSDSTVTPRETVHVLPRPDWRPVPESASTPRPATRCVVMNGQSRPLLKTSLPPRRARVSIGGTLLSDACIHPYANASPMKRAVSCSPGTPADHVPSVE